MSALTNFRKLFTAVVYVVHYARLLCRWIDKVDDRLQASTMPDPIKTASTNLRTATHDFCEDVLAYKQSL